MNPKRHIYLPLLIILLAAGLRIARIDAQSLWNDEGNSARIAERSVQKIIEGAGGDIHPPGYYLLLAGWRAVAGYSELALRMFSVFSSLIAIALVYRLGVRLLGPLEGLIAALLAAMNPFQVYYAQEARMYTLFAMLSAASILLTAEVLTIPGEMQARRFKPRRAALIIGGYILVSVLGLYTHYSFPFVILAETLVFLLWLIPRSKKLHGLAVWVGLQVVTLLLFAPWLGTAVRQITTWPTSASGVGTAALLANFAYGPTLPLEMAQAGMVPLFLIAVVGLFAPIDEDDWGGYLNFPERISLILLWCVIPPVLMILLGADGESFLKFLLPANLGLMLLISRGVVMGIDLGRSGEAPGAAQGGWLTLVVLALIGFGIYPLVGGLVNLYSNPAYARDNYRAIADRIRVEAGEEAAVILNAPNQWEVFTYYYPDGPNIAPLPDDSTVTTLDKLLENNDHIYTLYWGAEQQDPESLVRSILEERAFPLGADWYGGVQLVTYIPITDPGEGPQVEQDAQFGEAIRLTGYSLSTEEVEPGAPLGITLFWGADTLIEERFIVFVHVYAFDGALVAQHDSEPGNGLKPTSTWEPGQIITDNHGVVLPDNLSPGDYRLAVGIYHPEDGTRLDVTGSEDVVDNGLTLTNITVR